MGANSRTSAVDEVGIWRRWEAIGTKAERAHHMFAAAEVASPAEGGLKVVARTTGSPLD